MYTSRDTMRLWPCRSGVAAAARGRNITKLSISNISGSQWCEHGGEDSDLTFFIMFSIL